MNKPKRRKEAYNKTCEPLTEAQSSFLVISNSHIDGYNQGLAEMEKYHNWRMSQLPKLIKKILWDIGEYNDHGEYVIGKGDTQPFIDELAKRIRDEE